MRSRKAQNATQGMGSDEIVHDMDNVIKSWACHADDVCNCVLSS